MTEVPRTGLSLVPMTIKAAKLFVKEHHRHHRAPAGGLFAVGVSDGAKLVGVAIIGRPVARLSDDGFTAEVTRVATDGTKNACSMLYGAARRACRALGYRQIVTYTLEEEAGSSLKASGWWMTGLTAGSKWCRPSRKRKNEANTGAKVRWIGFQETP